MKTRLNTARDSCPKNYTRKVVYSPEAALYGRRFFVRVRMSYGGFWRLNFPPDVKKLKRFGDLNRLEKSNAKLRKNNTCFFAALQSNRRSNGTSSYYRTRHGKITTVLLKSPRRFRIEEIFGKITAASQHAVGFRPLYLFVSNTIDGHVRVLIPFRFQNRPQFGPLRKAYRPWASPGGGQDRALASPRNFN